MKEKLFRFLASYRATLLLMLIYAFLMALATIIEKNEGTPVAKAMIYYSPLFLFLQFLLVVNWACVTISHKLFAFRKWGYILVHGAFVVILAGAMITHLFGREGMMHLREGEKSDRIMMKSSMGEEEYTLPFKVELIDFELLRYPGSHSPSSYESRLRLYVDGEVKEEKVYMNNVLDLKGYRFFQASYDSDEEGTILSVSNDVAGRTVTYCGYGLLFAGLLGCFLDKTSRFRRLGRQLKTLQLVALAACLGIASSAAARSLAIPVSHAGKFGALPMQSVNGRIIPVNTFASEVLRKLQAENSIEGLTPDQFLLSLLVSPTEWAHIPLIKMEDSEISRLYKWSGNRISYRDAFDKNGFYKLGERVEEAYVKSPAMRTHLDKELMKLDEKVNTLHQLFNFQLLRLFPVSTDTVYHRWHAPGDELADLASDDSLSVINLFKQYRNEVREAMATGQWSKADAALAAISLYQQKNNTGLDISTGRMQAEISYNKLNLLLHCKRGYLILGGLLLVFSFGAWLKKKESIWEKRVGGVLLIGVLLCFLLHTYSLGMRWYISGYAPWSNSYETMVCLAWASVLGGLLFANRSFIAFALATLFGGVVLFVSSLNWMDPQITPLVPVLKSPWLMFHVATLIAAYGFLGISCMIGITNLLASAFMTSRNRDFLSVRIARLSIINEMSLLIGLALMAVGVFLGAIWANESWGRYWSWDPKETWALITTVVYAIVLHLRWFGKKENNRLFNLLSQLAFLSVLMTYFGVNYLLSGMHSYGGNAGLSALPFWVYLLGIIFFVLPGGMAYLSPTFSEPVIRSS
jgi:cytochrome c-type biogenesis protein CcsB